VNDADRVKLLFGPYKAPPLRRGDRSFCLLRDCDVVITSWTDARIPWPRCRGLDGTAGGSGLLLNEELARAARHESADALPGRTMLAVYGRRHDLVLSDGWANNGQRRERATR
jgi:hypothetical protein